MEDEDEALGTDRPRQPAWLVVGLGIASLVGTAIGLLALPQAWVAILAMTLVQLAVTGLGLVATRRPVLWAVAVGATCLGSVLLHPALAELAYSGATPWIGLGTAAATLTLYRHAEDWRSWAAGSTALVLGCVGLVTISIRAGVPAAPAIMSTSVYLLLGVLAALVIQLRNARADRLRRPELATAVNRSPVDPGAEPDRSPGTDGGGHPDPGARTLEGAVADTDAAADAGAVTGTGDVAAAGALTDAGAVPEGPTRRALAIVALRSDELADSTDDVAVRRAATDLREVAQRALAEVSTSTSAGASAETKVGTSETTPTDNSSEATVQTSAEQGTTPADDLPEREREILRLVATGASNAAIARSLYLSEATVKQYVSRLMRKFERDNRTQLALLAAPWFPAAG